MPPKTDRLGRWRQKGALVHKDAEIDSPQETSVWFLAHVDVMTKVCPTKNNTAGTRDAYGSESMGIRGWSASAR